jgi:hypothetical protein
MGGYKRRMDGASKERPGGLERVDQLVANAINGFERDADRQRHCEQDANHACSGCMVWASEIVTVTGLGLATVDWLMSQGMVIRSHNVSELRTEFDCFADVSKGFRQNCIWH